MLNLLKEIANEDKKAAITVSILFQNVERKKKACPSGAKQELHSCIV